MIRWLYERITGTPWYETVQASREGDRLIGAVYREELSRYSDAELLRHGDAIVARAREARRTRTGAVADAA